MSVVSFARQLGRTRQRHGTAAATQLAAFALARKAVALEHIHFFALDRPPKPSPEPSRYARMATIADLCALADDPAWDLGGLAAAELEHLYAAGHRCVLNVIDGAIAGYSWMNPNRCVVPKLRAAIELYPDEVHIYKGFTNPRFRGRELGVDRFAFWLNQFPERSHLTLIADFAFDNHASMARIGRLGLRLFGRGTYLARGSFERRIFTGGLTARAITCIPRDYRHRDH